MTKEDIAAELYKRAGIASGTAVRIYNMIREVGRGELSADNALHQMIEDYHDLKNLANDLTHLTDQLNREGK